MTDFRIAVVGAGIGGLFAAVACQKAGFPVTVFEQAEKIEPLGASLSLWPNAMQCIANLGLAQPVQDQGALIAQLAIRGIDQRPYFTLPLQPIYNRLEQSGYCIRRAALHSILLDALSPGSLKLGYQVNDMLTHPGQTELSFANHETHRFDLVIAADGIWSTLRSKILGQSLPDYGGYGAWLGLGSAPAPDPTLNEACEYFGPGGRFGLFETGNSQRYWFFVAKRKSPTRHPEMVDPHSLLNTLKDWPSFVRDQVAAATTKTVPYVSFFDRPVGAVWGSDQILLLGDAMHPYLPNLGQGACQAIEDGHVLAHGLRVGLRGARLRQFYQTARHKRARNFGRVSRRMGRISQAEGVIGRGFQRIFYAGIPTSLFAKDMQQQFTLPKLTH